MVFLMALRRMGLDIVALLPGGIGRLRSRLGRYFAVQGRPDGENAARIGLTGRAPG
jgi:hypothetical protein